MQLLGAGWDLRDVTRRYAGETVSFSRCAGGAAVAAEQATCTDVLVGEKAG